MDRRTDGRTDAMTDDNTHRINGGWGKNKANLRDLIAAISLVISNWIQIIDFSARVTLKFDGWPRKTIGHFFYTKSSFAHHFKSISDFKLELQSGNSQLGSKLMIFCPMWPWNLMDDLGKQQHLFYTTPSSVHHFKSIDEVKLGLQYGNAQFGSKLVIFFVPRDLEIWRMTLKTIGHLFYTTLALSISSKPWVNSNWSYSPETLNSGQNRQYFVPCDLEIWRMTLKNNRAPLLSNINFVHLFNAICKINWSYGPETAK